MVLPSLSKVIPVTAGVVLWLCSLLLASPALSQNPDDPRYVAEFEVHTAAEFMRLLRRAESLFLSGELAQSAGARVTFVLHGPEVRALLRQNYGSYRELVDLAARLSALGVVDVRACRTWMGGNSVDSTQLQPFVTTVAYGPGEVKRLVAEENYIYF